MKIKIQILILIILPALPAFSQFSGFPDITPRPPEPATLKPDIRIGNEPSSSRGYSYPGIRHPHHTDTYDYDSEILHRRNLINRKIIEEATAHIKEYSRKNHKNQKKHHTTSFNLFLNLISTQYEHEICIK